MGPKSFGNVTWWGLSPAFDVVPAIASDSTGDGPVNVLLVGAGDARHILTSIARSYRRPKRKVHFYILESNLEVVARQLMFLQLAVESPESMSTREKAETFLELFGNSLLRPQTREYLTKAASSLVRLVTSDPEEAAAAFPLVDLTSLKFKERDFLEAILKFWRETEPAKFPIHQLWDGRNRQYLETRYDCRKNAFDWDYNMKLVDRGAKVINGREYAEWREKGLAFQGRDGCYEFPNRTLASGVLVHIKGERVARRGYFGDIVTSPYIAYGLEPEDTDLLKTQNGIHVKTAADLSSIAVSTIMHEVAFKTKFDSKGEEDSGPKIVDVTEEESAKTNNSNTKNLSQTSPTLEEILEDQLGHDTTAFSETQKSASGDGKGVPFLPPISFPDFRVTFLPLSPVADLAKKAKFKNFFHFAFFSNSLVHFLEPATKAIFANKAELTVESTKFILDIQKEHHEKYAQKIIGMAEAAGFKRKTTFDPEKDATARFQFIVEGEE